MASMREIKRRRESIQSTGQVTRAMKLVAAARLQKARGQAEKSLPYFRALYQTVTGIVRRTAPMQHPYLTPGEGRSVGMIVMSSNRGLAGGYNAGIVRAVAAEGLERENVRIYAVGRKGRDELAGLGFRIAGDYSDRMNVPSLAGARQIAEDVLRAYDEKEIDGIRLAFTGFQTMITHIPILAGILPVDIRTSPPFLGIGQEETGTDMEDLLWMNYEPGAGEVLRLLIPDYVVGMIYGALLQSFASENAARMRAMDSASSNGKELLKELDLSYHRARQTSITRELTEMIAGSGGGLKRTGQKE